MFERFTPQARETVLLAQEEARQLGHTYIGTEHLLLALLAPGRDTVARQTLTAVGVGHERVRAAILEIVGPGEGSEPSTMPFGKIPFTPRSKKVLELSLREALRLRHKFIAPEHILLGLLREGEGVAARILADEGVNFDRLRHEILDRIGPEPEVRRPGRFGRGRFQRVPDPRVARMTRGGAGLADRAVALAGDAPVASHHYLLAMLAEEDTLAAKVLAALGVTREAVQAKLAEVGAEGTSDELPETAGARGTSLAVEGDTVQVRIQAPALTQRLTQLMEAQQAAILKGAELPGSERLWKALQPILDDVVNELESKHGPLSTPPGWPDEVTVAAYAVTSQPGGFAGLMKVAEGVDERAVRAWLAGSLGSSRFSGPSDDGIAFLMVEVARTGDVVPDAADPEAWMIARFSSGVGPARARAPRRPLGELLAFAVDDLNRAA